MLSGADHERKRTAERAGRRAEVSLMPSTFPPDAVAVIYRPARSAMTSGQANTRTWKLRFERRSPPFIEPLMGWTGGDDTLTQVELTFPTAEAAIAYARRQGCNCVVHGMEEVAMANLRARSTSDAATGTVRWSGRGGSTGLSARPDWTLGDILSEPIAHWSIPRLALSARMKCCAIRNFPWSRSVKFCAGGHWTPISSRLR